jgi:hypothetical protein
VSSSALSKCGRRRRVLQAFSFLAAGTVLGSFACGANNTRDRARSEAPQESQLQAALVAPAPVQAPEPVLLPDPGASEPLMAADLQARSAAVRVVEDLGAELELMRKVHKDLREGRPQEALWTVDELTESFEYGMMAEPREFARMIALCRLGREQDAHVRATRFLATRPKSEYRERVRKLCSDASFD